MEWCQERLSLSPHSLILGSFSIPEASDSEEGVLVHKVPLLPRRTSLGQGTYSEAHLGLRDLEVWRHQLLPIAFSMGIIQLLTQLDGKFLKSLVAACCLVGPPAHILHCLGLADGV